MLLDDNIQETQQEQDIPEAKEESPEDNTLKKYEEVIEQQTKLINTLTKQTELNNKVNSQLIESLNQKLNQQTADKGPYDWQDKFLNEKFQLQGQIDFNSNTNDMEQMALWILKDLKEQGKTPEQIQFTMDRFFKGLTQPSPHETVK